MKIFILLIIIILILAGVVVGAWYYQKTENEYRACLSKCSEELGSCGAFTTLGNPVKEADCEVCQASCREEYGK